MTLGTLSRAEAALGRPLTRIALGALAAGTVAFVLALALGREEAAFAVLAASWLHFAGMAAGAVAITAALRLARARWAPAVLPIAEAGAGFFGPALVLLAVVVTGAPVFVARLRGGGALRHATLALGLLASSAILFALGARLVAASRRADDAGRLRARSVVYLLVYAVVLSVWTFQLVMSIWGGPAMTVLPAYYFLGAFVSGLAWIALVAAVRDVSGPDLRHDLGKLLFGLIVVWSYLLWSLFLPTWYGNLPDEVGPLLARWRGQWRPLTAVVLVAVFAWPFWLLFSERLKRRRATLGAGAAAILLGLLGERFLLVVPSLGLPREPGTVLLGVLVAAGVAGLFLLSVAPGLVTVARTREH